MTITMKRGLAAIVLAALAGSACAHTGHGTTTFYAGLAHGAEAPAGGGYAGYAAGFLLTSAALHFGGVCAGLSLRRAWASRATQVVGGLGAACGSAGLLLLGQL